jgi:hypothetical protein
MLHIAKPCHENWNTMSTQPEGRHCDSCAKVVKDFSGMSDAELIAYMQRGKSNECGRFRRDQMRVISGKRNSLFHAFKFKAAAFWGLVLSKVLMPDHASAQSTTPPTGIDELKNRSSEVKNMYSDSVVYHITGSVSDKEGDKIRYAVVKVKVNGKPVGGSVYTDNNGNFELNVKAASSDDQITLEFSKDRHRTVRVRSYIPDGKPLEVRLKNKRDGWHPFRDRYIMGAYAYD